MSNELTIFDHLSYVQKALNAPKTRLNKFANYYYRNCEDIVEAVKKIMPDGCYILMSDTTWMSGEWHYIKATVTFGYKDKTIVTEGLAREPIEKKGNDVAQITGASSSYARKYALNGLFAIDDSKDADDDGSDTKEYREPPKRQTVLTDEPKGISHKQALDLSALIIEAKANVKTLMEHYRVISLNDLTFEQYEDAMRKLKSKIIKPSDYARV